MKYILITAETQANVDRRKGPDAKAYWDGWAAYGAALKQAGVFVGGAGLEPVHTATTVRVKDGKRLVQDGPYAEAKEQFGGYYIIDVPSLDAALEWAARCPALPDGAVEVRPVLMTG